MSFTETFHGENIYLFMLRNRGSDSKSWIVIIGRAMAGVGASGSRYLKMERKLVGLGSRVIIWTRVGHRRVVECFLELGNADQTMKSHHYCLEMLYKRLLRANDLSAQFVTI